MSATGIFAEAQATVVATLTALGVAVVTDTRNARPMSVLVHPPNFECFNSNVATIEFTLSILAAPPGNQDAADYLVTTADTIMDSALSMISGRPGMAEIGGQAVPTYELLIRVGTQRSA